MINLRPFQESDIPQLISWIPDARFLLRWAGPQYKFPLDHNQILKGMEKTRGEKPSVVMFTALGESDATILGHSELLWIDYEKRTAVLGRVIIGEMKNHGRGLGTALVAETLDYGFNVLQLAEISLGVFDFNKSAIACYKKLGFAQYEFRENAKQFEGEPWNVVMMKLSSQTWRENRLFASSVKRSVDSRRTNDPVSVRALTARDAESYHDLRLRALREQPPAFNSLPEEEPGISETAVSLAKNEDCSFLGAFRNEQLVGIIRVSRYSASNEKHRACLSGLYVAPQFRRNGCGKALVRQALKWAEKTPGLRRINLTVVTQQESAVHLYQSLGFSIYGTERETFSSDGHFYDEHLMTMELAAKNDQNNEENIQTRLA